MTVQHTFRDWPSLQQFVIEQQRQHGLSDERLAKKAGLSMRFMQFVRTGKRGPTAMSMTKLLPALGFQLAAIPLEETQPKRNT